VKIGRPTMKLMVRQKSLKYFLNKTSAKHIKPSSWLAHGHGRTPFCCYPLIFALILWLQQRRYFPVDTVAYVSRNALWRVCVCTKYLRLIARWLGRTDLNKSMYKITQRDGRQAAFLSASRVKRMILSHLILCRK